MLRLFVILSYGEAQLRWRARWLEFLRATNPKTTAPNGNFYHISVVALNLNLLRPMNGQS